MIIFGKIPGAIIAVESSLKCFCLKCDQITGITDESYKPISRKVLIEKSKCKRCSRIQRNYRKFVAFSPETYKKIAHFGKTTRYSEMSWTTLAPEIPNFAYITPTIVRRMFVSGNPRYKILTKAVKEEINVKISNIENSLIAGGDINIQTGGIIPRRRPGGPAQQNPYRWRPGGTVPYRPYMQQQPSSQQYEPYYNSSHPAQQEIQELTDLLQGLRNNVLEQEDREALRNRYLERIRAMSDIQRRSFLSQEVHPNWCMCQRCEGGASNA